MHIELLTQKGIGINLQKSIYTNQFTEFKLQKSIYRNQLNSDNMQIDWCIDLASKKDPTSFAHNSKKLSVSSGTVAYIRYVCAHIHLWS